MCLSTETRTAIIEWMEKNHISRSSLARKLEMSRGQLSNILNGRDPIGMQMAERLVAALGCRIRVKLEKK